MPYDLPKFAVPLGSKVKDKSSGLEGILVGASWRIGYSIQYTLQPSSLDGRNIPDAWDIDHFNLETIDSGISERLPAMSEMLYTFEQKGRDRVTGVSGVVSAFYFSMNGCISVVISYKDKNDKAETLMISQDRFIADPEKVEAKPQARTGAPMTRRSQAKY
jgi:hypothetical protein